jgi:hypothetical protein
MSYSLIDVIPWSLIYGAQNEKHSLEINELETRLVDYQNNIDKNIEFLLDSLINTSTADFNNFHSNIWIMFLNQKQFITAEKIDKACQKFLSNNDKNWWHHTYTQSTVNRADIMKNNLII